MDTTNLQWRIDVIEFNRDLAQLRDDSAQRFGFVANALRSLKANSKLTPELTNWLSEAEAKSAEFGLVAWSRDTLFCRNDPARSNRAAHDYFADITGLPGKPAHNPLR